MIWNAPQDREFNSDIQMYTILYKRKEPTNAHRRFIMGVVWLVLALVTRLVLCDSITIFRACMSPQGLRCYYGFPFVAMRCASCKHVGCRHTSNGCSDHLCTAPERPCTMKVTIAHHHTYAWSEYQVRPPLRCVRMRLVRSDQQFLKSREQARAGLVI